MTRQLLPSILLLCNCPMSLLCASLAHLIKSRGFNDVAKRGRRWATEGATTCGIVSFLQRAIFVCSATIFNSRRIDLAIAWNRLINAVNTLYYFHLSSYSDAGWRNCPSCVAMRATTRPTLLFPVVWGQWVGSPVTWGAATNRLRK